MRVRLIEWPSIPIYQIQWLDGSEWRTLEQTDNATRATLVYREALKNGRKIIAEETVSHLEPLR